ncbi:MAG: hypothetical protein IKB42_02325 [Clostridia bacterium]|nr:hypothetical protein [Clostridia bacterium]
MTLTTRMELKTLLEKFNKLEYRMDTLVEEARTIANYGENPKHIAKLTKLITKLPVTKDNFAETSRRLNNSVYRDVYYLKTRRENLTNTFYSLMDYATIKLVDCGFNPEDINIYPNNDKEEIKNAEIKQTVENIRDIQEALVNDETLETRTENTLINEESAEFARLVELIEADKSLADIEKKDVAPMYAMVIETYSRLNAKLKLMEKEQTRAKHATNSNFLNYNRGSNSKTPRADRVIEQYNIQLEERARAPKDEGRGR